MKTMMMSPANYAAFKAEYRRSVWALMMAGDVKGWMEFFEMIGSGESRALLAEHVSYPV
jgi:hypothetical protein